MLRIKIYEFSILLFSIFIAFQFHNVSSTNDKGKAKDDHAAYSNFFMEEFKAHSYFPPGPGNGPKKPAPAPAPTPAPHGKDGKKGGEGHGLPESIAQLFGQKSSHKFFQEEIKHHDQNKKPQSRQPGNIGSQEENPTTEMPEATAEEPPAEESPPEEEPQLLGRGLFRKPTTTKKPKSTTKKKKKKKTTTTAATTPTPTTEIPAIVAEPTTELIREEFPGMAKVPDEAPVQMGRVIRKQITTKGPPKKKTTVSALKGLKELKELAGQSSEEATKKKKKPKKKGNGTATGAGVTTSPGVEPIELAAPSTLPTVDVPALAAVDPNSQPRAKRQILKEGYKAISIEGKSDEEEEDDDAVSDALNDDSEESDEDAKKKIMKRKRPRKGEKTTKSPILQPNHPTELANAVVTKAPDVITTTTTMTTTTMTTTTISPLIVPPVSKTPEIAKADLPPPTGGESSGGTKKPKRKKKKKKKKGVKGSKTGAGAPNTSAKTPPVVQEAETATPNPIPAPVNPATPASPLVKVSYN